MTQLQIPSIDQLLKKPASPGILPPGMPQAQSQPMGLDPLLQAKLAEIKNAPSLATRIFNPILHGVGFLGNILDTPGAVVRTSIDALQGDRPASDVFSSIYDFSKRATGEEVLNHHGGFWAGLGAEIALDPLLFFGVGAKSAAKLAAEDMTKLTARKTVLRSAIKASKFASESHIQLVREEAEVLDRISNLRKTVLEIADRGLEEERPVFREAHKYLVEAEAELPEVQKRLAAARGTQESRIGLIKEYRATKKRLGQKSLEYVRAGGKDAEHRMALAFDPIFKKKLFGMDSPVPVIHSKAVNQVVAAPFRTVAGLLDHVPGVPFAKQMARDAFVDKLQDPVLRQMKQLTKAKLRTGGLDIAATAQALDASFTDLAKELVDKGIVKNQEEMVQFFLKASELDGIAQRTQDKLMPIIKALYYGKADSFSAGLKQLERSAIEAPIIIEQVKNLASELTDRFHQYNIAQEAGDIAAVKVITRKIDELLAGSNQFLNVLSGTVKNGDEWTHFDEFTQSWMVQGAKTYTYDQAGILDHLGKLSETLEKRVKKVNKLRGLQDTAVQRGKEYLAIPQVIRDFAREYGQALDSHFQEALLQGVPFAPRKGVIGYLHRATTPEALKLLEDSDIADQIEKKFFAKWQKLGSPSNFKTGVQKSRKAEEKFVEEINQYFKEVSGKDIEFFTTDPKQIYAHYRSSLARAQARTQLISMWTQTAMVWGKQPTGSSISLAKFIKGDKVSIPKMLRFGTASWDYKATTKEIAKALKEAGYGKIRIPKEGLKELDMLLEATMGKFEKIGPIMQQYDKIMNIFRGSLINFFPAYGVRNLMTNVIMNVMAGDVAPRHYKQALEMYNAGLKTLQEKEVTTHLRFSTLSEGEKAKYILDDQGEVRRWFHGTSADFAEHSKQFRGAQTGPGTGMYADFYASNPQTAGTSYYTQSLVHAESERKLGYRLEEMRVRIRGGMHPQELEMYDRYLRFKAQYEYFSGQVEHLKGTLDKKELEKMIKYKKGAAREMSSPYYDSIRSEIDKLEDVEAQLAAIELKGANLRMAAIKMQNPVIVDMKGSGYVGKDVENIMFRARAEGHDGVVFRNTSDSVADDPTDIVAIFKKEQIEPWFSGERGRPQYKVQQVIKRDLTPAEKGFHAAAEGGVFGTSRTSIFESLFGTSFAVEGRPKSKLSRVFKDPIRELSGGRVPEKATRFAPFGFRGNQNIENVSRLALYLAKKEKGLSHVEALAEVNKYLFDYGDLTAFEQKYLRRNMLFYTFTRKNIPLMLHTMVDHPRFLLNYARATSQTAGHGKARPSWLPDSFHLGSINGKELSVAFGLPFEDLNMFDLQGQGLARPLQTLIGQTNPMLKEIIQEGTGTDLFTGQPLQGSRFERLLKASPASRAVGTIQSLFEPPHSMSRKAKALQFFTGVAVRKTDPESARMAADMDSVKQRLDEMWRQGVARKRQSFSYEYDRDGNRLKEDEMKLLFKLNSRLKKGQSDYIKSQQQ